MKTDERVVIVGGGMSGLSAAYELCRNGIPVCLLEARERLGGRAFTKFVEGMPVELGAEFIHGKPPEIHDPLRKADIKITEVDGDAWCSSNGRLTSCNFFSQVESILDKMDDSEPDQSFLDFLKRPVLPKIKAKDEIRRRAIDYVSGFNAADPALIGTHWLVASQRAEEKIEGDRAFRAARGYADLIDVFLEQLKQFQVEVRCGHVVESIDWRSQIVTITGHDARGTFKLDAPAVLVTLPLSLLQSQPDSTGGVEFNPPLPAEKRNAMKNLEMGHVIRVVLRFRERFWETIKPSLRSNKTLADMSFLFSQDEWFPTWWTAMPEKNSMITGWAPFRSADLLSAESPDVVVERALHTLGRLLRVDFPEIEHLLEDAHYQNWQADPFSRGAYSYGKVGADGAQQALATPLGGTIFFAGEASDTTGHNGTVHGAIASGLRAAKQIRDSR